MGAATLQSPAEARTKSLQLDAVIRAALDNGQEVKHADIKLKLAEARLREAKGAFDWRTTARAGWKQLYFPKAEIIHGYSVLTNNVETTSNVQIEMGVSHLFRNGIRIEPGISYFPVLNASRAQTFGAVRPMPFVNLQIPLLHAFDEDNTAAANERAALKEETGSIYDRTAAQQQAVFNAVQTYWRCVAAQEMTSILEAEQASSEIYFRTLRAQQKSGQIDMATVEMASAKEIHRNSELLQARENAAQCSMYLSLLIGSKTAPELPTMSDAFPQMQDLAPVARQLRDNTLNEVAQKHRPDIAADEQDISAADDRVASAKAGQDPKVNLLVNPDGAFVSVSMSIEGNSADGAKEAAEAEAAEARLTLTELHQQIGREVTSAVVALRDSLSTLATLRASNRMMSQIVEESRRAERAGGLDAKDVHAREEEQVDLKLELVQASLDCAVDLAKLRLVTGTVATQGSSAASDDTALFKSLEF
jgi:outer membrane protein TolC